jgi:hypothetical protein
METAGLMDLPQAKWFVEVQLRERDWVSIRLAEYSWLLVKVFVFTLSNNC